MGTTIDLKFIYKKRSCSGIFSCLYSNSHLERDCFSSPELTCTCLVWEATEATKWTPLSGFLLMGLESLSKKMIKFNLSEKIRKSKELILCRAAPSFVIFDRERPWLSKPQPPPSARLQQLSRFRSARRYQHIPPQTPRVLTWGFNTSWLSTALLYLQMKKNINSTFSSSAFSMRVKVPKVVVVPNADLPLYRTETYLLRPELDLHELQS